MAKFTLVSATTTRDPHRGLMTRAYYKQDPSNQQEKPHCLVVFNRWPTVTIEGEVVEFPLDGVYEDKYHRKHNKLDFLCPKTKEGLFAMGHCPEEIAAKMLTRLRKIEV